MILIAPKVLEQIVQDAFREGFREGKDGGWIGYVPWKESDALKEVKQLIKDKKE